MPGIRTCVEPESAFDFSVADEAYQLELHLQRKFEEDVARIFDESIYSDFELVCGRSKILTHTCILKARTKRFYQKLENVLNFNINRNTYDEIYSFISDAYTECNINNQEKEILAYIDNNLSTLITSPIIKDYTAQTQSLPPLGTTEDIDESDVFLTPKCTTPYIEKRQVKSLSSSPSIELTKEYYALVPIDSSLLDRELKEQDVLSDAFQSIIKTQVEDTNKEKSLLRNKPTSLSLRSSHASKTGIHSNNCDKSTKFSTKENSTAHIIKSPEKKINIPSLTKNNTQTFELRNNIKEDFKKTNYPVTEKVTDIAYSPDSLITDDPSSSSDYLSAAYNFSPGVSSSGGISQLNVAKNINKMDNVFTSSDSGLESTGLLESLNGQKDVTLTDTSLTESTLHDLITDDASHSSSPLPEINHLQRFKYENSSQTASASATCSDKDYSSQRKKKSFKGGSGCKSSKAEKQRQNEEIVILESSSLSSETGSWESVFPLKREEKEVCTAFLNNERINSNGDSKYNKFENTPVISYEDDKCPSLVQRSPFKSTSCFIDAASLVDDDETIKVQSDAVGSKQQNEIMGDILPAPSQPVPCSTAKSDISPNDWSETHDNDDSLEQLDAKDPDSLQKDLSPTIFEMTPITEDSLCTNAFESAANADRPAIELNESLHDQYEKDDNYVSRTGIISSTPHNSIMSLRASKLKQNDSEDGDSDTTVVSQDGPSSLRKLKNYIDYSPIVSGGASIEDHLPQLSSHVGSPLARRKIENIPIVSGAYIPEEEVKKKIRKSPKPTNAAAWVVDMSENLEIDKNVSAEYKKPGDRKCETLKNESKLISIHDTISKSRSSVDSDSSEKSSHQFYIDLSSLPDPLPPKNEINSNSVNEKKNIFSMYIDLGEKSTLKEMPARLSSSLNTKKNTESSKSSQIPECKTVNNTKSVKKLSSDSGDKIVSDECFSSKPNKKGDTKLLDTPTKNSSIEPGSTDSPPIAIKNTMSYFEEYEALCAIPDISVSDIIQLPEKSLKSKPTDANNKLDLEVVREEKTEQFIVATAKEVKKSNRVAAAAAAMDVFVRLSDLDKPKLHLESTDIIYEHAVTDIRMTRSIPDSSNWGEANHTGTSRSIEVISSFHSENALSLNRLFPHLKNEFSRSMPGSLTSRTRSPMRAVSIIGGDMEEQASDMSEVSSVQSSLCRSVVENSTTEDSQTSSLIGNCQSRLGQDLLRMFLEEIAPDVVVEASGRRFKAHKCILSSRCQYFAGILSGGWVESAGNVIVLPPFSYNVVHFALCHIYSGVSTIPDSISMVELATIADMLGLEGLKEAIMFTLRVKYCHHFHKPCHVCTAGVLECFPLSSVYGLDDLYHKCLRWITKYFHKVWPTKAFATLPKELLDKCYQQHIVNMTTDNVVDTVCGCGMTVAALQSSRWAETVARMCRRLMNAAAHYVASRLLAIVRIVATMPVEMPPPAVQALDDCLAAAIEWAPPDEACRAYAFLSHIVKEIRSQPNPKPDLVTNGDLLGKGTLLWMHANEWRLRCESSIVRSAPRAIDTQAFKDLPHDLRKRLRELGCIIYGTRSMSSTAAMQDKKIKSTHITNKQTRPHNSTRSLDMEHVRASFVPYSPKPTLGSTDNRLNNSQRIKKMPISNPPKIRTTKAQEERARFNLSQTNQSQDRNKNPSTGRSHHRFENTKPRYLESRPIKETNKKSAVNRLTVKMVSSSESSRNSSPVLARNLRTSRVKARQPPELGSHAMSQDSLATSSRPRTAEPSTDSLSESQTSNKYATYTKVKHSKGSVESVKSYNRTTFGLSPSTNNMRTKIPVYLNHVKAESSQKRIVNGRAPAVCASTRPAPDRKISGSLMMATKSSSAKMVPKINKEQPSKPSPKQQKSSKTSNKQQQESTPEHNPLDIPVMGRSGTFLKDEPTFGDKTTNIDIEQ